jgi:patatin-related protein
MSRDALPSPGAESHGDPSTPPETVRAPAGDVKELRLGLVCYGGVSLAIYMHGITKEIHRAVRASVVEEHGLSSHSNARSEEAYRELLAALGEERGVHTRIVVDAIAGTSAGGINGIFLAKALAHNLNQDSLRDLWFEHGDLERLIRPQTSLAGRVAGRLVAGALRLRGGGPVPSQEAKRKLAAAALSIRTDSLLDGDEMARRIYEALSGMESKESAPAEPPSLLPDLHLLELFVTATDHHGYPRQLPIADPPSVAERQHRHVLRFGFRSDQESNFTERQNPALTLAARATSSLPAGFNTVHVGSFPRVLSLPPETYDDIAPFFRAYGLAQANPSWAYLVDGGVLDNKPFGPVLEAIKERPAATEVERYLVFLEPDPARPAKQGGPLLEPKPIQAALGALSGLPRTEPILDELTDLLKRNEHVRAVRDTIEANWGPVEEKVRDLVGDLGDAPALDDARLKEANEKIHEAATSLNALAYPTYVRLKVRSAIDEFGRAACLVCDYTDESNQAFLVREVVRGWAERRQLFQHEDAVSEAQLAFVRDFDLAYTRRRLMFVVAGVSWLYRDLDTKAGMPPRTGLDSLKERLYNAVAAIEWLSSGRGFAEEVLGGVRTCFGEERVNEHLLAHGFEVDEFLDAHGGELDELNEALRRFLAEKLRNFTPELYGDLLALTADWPQGETTTKIRGDLLIRYLGFPVWDALLYPLQAYTDVNERDAVRVARLSPLDSECLKPLGEKKVLGADLGHAYAFFSRHARENDYLWGRLDAAERIVRLLLGKTHPDYRRWCKAAFLAVLEEDAADLPALGVELADLRRQVDAL